MEVVHRPSTPIQPQKSDTKGRENNAPEVVQQYQEGDKIGSPALLIYHPQTPQPPPSIPLLPPLPPPSLHHQPSWHQQQPVHRPFPIVPPYYHPHGSSLALPVPPVDVSPAREKKRICGMRRKLFVVLLVLAWLIIVGVSVGLGVKIGVVDQKNNVNYGESTEAGGSTIPTSLECPLGSTQQITTTSGVKFIHLCAVDYSGRGEATDIGNERTPTFKACLEACAQTPGCTGAGWGPRLVEEPARGTCWMKNNLNVSHEATFDFNFGIRLD